MQILTRLTRSKRSSDSNSVPPFDCFSVKDGEFRVYSGSRNEKEFIDYVEKEKWKTEEVLPGWKVG